ncbi:TPA: glycosyltransferase family 2 protein [Candidatus Woesearchaeota archaeon]|nr:glycosyltransferase family 2 protein [Candidatus Woesearchaeota archaeon]HII68547.1 glycosyltransferase family 2 protein [Candidatus Woesearchaeota archaeon]
MSSERQHKHVFAVIPAYNEESTIAAVLFETKKYVDGIIVVDDHSSDATPSLSEKYAVVIRNAKNVGYGKSINTGFAHAQKLGAAIVVTLDADGQHLASDIPLLIAPIINGASDVTVGLRPYAARFMETVFRRYGKQHGIEDPLCGMKAYSMAVYEQFGFFESFPSIGTQLVFGAKKKGYRIRNVPIHLKKRADTPRFGRTLSANLKILRGLILLKKYINSLNK